MYEVARKGDIPSSNDNWSSVINGKNIVMLNIRNRKDDMTPSLIESMLRHEQNVNGSPPGQLYSISFETEPASGFLNKLIMGRVLGTDQDDQDLKILKKVKKLLQEKKNYDILFVLREKQIPAHKEILSTRSSYFSKMFSSGMQESFQAKINLTEISSKAFEALLKYFYEGTLPTDEVIVKELIIYSEKILLKRLKDHCEKTLVSSVAEGNAVELYEISKLSASENLKKATLEFMGKNLSHFADQLVVLSTK